MHEQQIEQQIYEGAVHIAGNLALEIPDNDIVVTRALSLAQKIYERMTLKPPEPPARAEVVETGYEELPEELQADLMTQQSSAEDDPQANYLDEVFLT